MFFEVFFLDKWLKSVKSYKLLTLKKKKIWKGILISILQTIYKNSDVAPEKISTGPKDTNTFIKLLSSLCLFVSS